MNSLKNGNYYYYFPRTISEKSATTKENRCNVTDIDQIDVTIKIWDDHIERLESKLSFLIRSYGDNPNSDLLYQHEKKIATLKREINDAIEQRQRQITIIT